MNWDATNQRWFGPGNYSWIYPNWQHPDGNYSSIRAWIAPSSGTVSIYGLVKKADIGGGDGVKATISHTNSSHTIGNGIFARDISYNDAIGYTIDVSRPVQTGDKLYFGVEAKGNPYYDATFWNPTIVFVPSGSSSSPPPGSTIYTAATHFSSIQGQNGWYYQYWNGSSYVNMSWDGANGRWFGPGNYLWVYSDGQHPNSADSVRTFAPGRRGSVTITGVVRKNDIGGGDGIRAQIYMNNTIVFDQDIYYSDSIGYVINVSLSVEDQTRLYFRVNQKSNYFNDSTYWNPSIVFTPR
jgi:hypothetical protein